MAHLFRCLAGFPQVKLLGLKIALKLSHRIAAKVTVCTVQMGGGEVVDINTGVFYSNKKNVSNHGHSKWWLHSIWSQNISHVGFIRHFYFSKTKFLHEGCMISLFFCCIFKLKIQILWNIFFAKNTKWRMNQNNRFFNNCF
jgi:hypothetical protein